MSRTNIDPRRRRIALQARTNGRLKAAIDKIVDEAVIRYNRGDDGYITVVSYHTSLLTNVSDDTMKKLAYNALTERLHPKYSGVTLLRLSHITAQSVGFSVFTVYKYKFKFWPADENLGE